ncbi:MAG: peptide deformylase [Bacteriovoracaceae bacterium]|jgi:peptide deformylase|nr:peptide deformylase [Bacteriovoracaceae bacterium]
METLTNSSSYTYNQLCSKAETLKVLTYPNPILRKKSEDVTDFDEGLKEFVSKMLITMYLAPGIGLAAPQTGLLKKILIIDLDYKKEIIEKFSGEDEIQYSGFNPLVLINPKILSGSGSQKSQEGCLSLPGIYEDVERFSKITISYQTLSGETKMLESDDLQSICIQHEMDHLEGVVFLDHLSRLKKQFYIKKIQKKKRS